MKQIFSFSVCPLLFNLSTPPCRTLHSWTLSKMLFVQWWRLFCPYQDSTVCLLSASLPSSEIKGLLRNVCVYVVCPHVCVGVKANVNWNDRDYRATLLYACLKTALARGAWWTVKKKGSVGCLLCFCFKRRPLGLFMTGISPLITCSGLVKCIYNNLSNGTVACPVECNACWCRG